MSELLEIFFINKNKIFKLNFFIVSFSFFLEFFELINKSLKIFVVGKKDEFNT